MSRKWLSWRSRIMPIWLWHAMFDGTWLCRCEHSRYYREIGATPEEENDA